VILENFYINLFKYWLYNIKMTRFLKLTNYVINTRYITNIKIDKDLYQINMNCNHTGFILFGSGSFGSQETVLNVSKDEEDYNKISKWIEKMDKE